MARQVRQTREKPQEEYHKRQLRRNQIIFAIFSVFLIASMVLSLIRF